MTPPQMVAMIAAVCIALPIYVVTGLYRAIFRFSGGTALMSLVKASTAVCVIFLLIFTVIGVPGVPRSVGLAIPVMLFVNVGASRLLVRYWLGGRYVRNLNRRALPQVLIYGAGSAGRQLAGALVGGREMVVRGFIDDARNLQGGTINGSVSYTHLRAHET